MQLRISRLGAWVDAGEKPRTMGYSLIMRTLYRYGAKRDLRN